MTTLERRADESGGRRPTFRRVASSTSAGPYRNAGPRSSPGPGAQVLAPAQKIGIPIEFVKFDEAHCRSPRPAPRASTSTSAPPGSPRSSAFAAAGDQPGAWNQVGGGALGLSLVGLDGHQTAVRVDTSGVNDAFDNGGTKGDAEALLDSLLDGSNTVVIRGLAPGSYDVFTYARAPDSATATTNVEVLGSSDPLKASGGAWGGALQEGITHTRHALTLGGQRQALALGRVDQAAVPGAEVPSLRGASGAQLFDVHGGMLHGTGAVGTRLVGRLPDAYRHRRLSRAMPLPYTKTPRPAPHDSSSHR